MITVKANHSDMIADTKRLLRERGAQEVSDVEAQKITADAAEFFKILLNWNHNSTGDESLTDDR